MDKWREWLQPLAEELKSIPPGADLHDQLRNLLDDWQSRRQQIDQDFALRLSFFLGTLSGKGIHTDVSDLIERLMEFGHSGLVMSPPQNRSTDSPRQSVSSPRTEQPTPQMAPPEAPPRYVSAGEDEEYIELDPGSGNDPPSRGVTHPDPPVTPANEETERDDDPKQGETGAGAPGYPEVERRVNSAYRLHLDRKHGEIEKLQEVLAQKADEALAQNKAFGDLLKTERAALQQANSVNDINEMKQILIGGTEELLAGQKDMDEKLRSSFEYLQVIKSDSERLHDELNKVRQLSLTDENTGLPNRRAFMRRLEDEIQRVKKYGMPLILALIDLDFFKEINDQYGHPGGDAVLNWYAEKALPMFRRSDMVARFGGEEFAVLFPATTGDGAGRAIAKLRQFVTGQTVHNDGDTIRVPTFSAGLAGFHSDDTETTLIKRADQALYRAKSSGRNRTEVDQATSKAEGANGRKS